MLGCNHTDTIDEIPLDLNSITLLEYTKMSLEYAANDLREGNKNLKDHGSFNIAIHDFINQTLQSQQKEDALITFSNFSIRSEANEETVGQERSKTIIDIENSVTESHDLSMFMENIARLKQEILDNELLSEKDRNIALFEVGMSELYVDFLYQNRDLLERNSSTEISNSKAGLRDWWDRNKAAIKCGLSIYAGWVTGGVTGCLGAAAVLWSTGPGAVAGCAVAGGVLAVSGAITGAVTGGCFELCRTEKLLLTEVFYTL